MPLAKFSGESMAFWYETKKAGKLCDTQQTGFFTRRHRVDESKVTQCLSCVAAASSFLRCLAAVVGELFVPDHLSLIKY